jgi:hypothetical protein
LQNSMTDSGHSLASRYTDAHKRAAVRLVRPDIGQFLRIEQQLRSIDLCAVQRATTSAAMMEKSSSAT